MASVYPLEVAYVLYFNIHPTSVFQISHTIYAVRDIQVFVMYCVYGASRSSLLIESTGSMIFKILHYMTGDTVIRFFFVS